MIKVQGIPNGGYLLISKGRLVRNSSVLGSAGELFQALVSMGDQSQFDEQATANVSSEIERLSTHV